MNFVLPRPFLTICLLISCAGLSIFAQPALAVTAFKQAVAESASRDGDIAEFYRETNFGPVWTEQTETGMMRRKALIQALAAADDHALPAARYDTDDLVAQMAAAKSPRDLGLVEVALTKAYLSYARDVSTGMFVPSQLDEGIVRKVDRKDRADLMRELASAQDPKLHIKSLPPRSPEYTRLMKEKLRLEAVIERGGWGAVVSAKKLEFGDRGASVVAMRNRLIALGFMQRSSTAEFDADLQKAVQAFQLAHGLEADGVAGQGTLEEINRAPEDRLKSVMVAMERERWLSRANEGREILVNLTDFTAKIFDDGKVTFRTRSVIGKNRKDQRSPEFSDIMDHMVINPTWNVPRSIATKEYLPQMQQNPNAVGHLRLIDARGRVVSREGLDFSQYNVRNFPFDMKQAPGSRNALGLVKFMFPNKHNIYLHDTPQKSLFARETRAFSHGCIRLRDPFDFAYALLARQESNPKEFFQTTLKTGRETHVNLEQNIPIHIIYRTAYTEAKGPVQYRRDVYGRDATIWKAMTNEGVVLPSYQG